MQAKDVDEAVILKFLAGHQGRWATHWDQPTKMITVRDVVPPPVPAKVLLAKMRSLYRRGLVGGCDCGCRGDWEITDVGLALIGQQRTTPYTGY